MIISTSACPECGAALRGQRARGLCPRCLLGTVLRGPEDPEVRPAAERGENVAEERKIHAFGDYELVREVGRGGMGIVYEAWQLSLRRRVALKMVLPARLASPTDVERFRLEAEAVASLDHPGILPIYNVGAHQGQHYFTMKLAEGGSLADRIARRPLSPPSLPGETVSSRPAGHDLASTDRSGLATTTWDPGSGPGPAGPPAGTLSREGTMTPGVDLREIAALVEQVARALHYAHQRGIQHRDIKPGNILLDASGHPFVSDFGLAKFMDRDIDLTRSTTVMGSPCYMSPEQAAGQVRLITTATDIYSLGVVLFELLCGRPPFRGPTVLETMRLLTETEAPSPRKLNQGRSRSGNDLPQVPRKRSRAALRLRGGAGG